MKKWKLKQFFFKDWTTYFYYHIYNSYSIIFIILLFILSFAMFSPVFTNLLIFTFFNIVKNAFLLIPSRFQGFNISTKQNFLSNKNVPVIALKVWFGSKEANIGNFCTWTPHFGTKLCPYVLIIQAHIEENSTDNLCFIFFKCFYQVDLEKF